MIIVGHIVIRFGREPPLYATELDIEVNFYKQEPTKMYYA